MAVGAVDAHLTVALLVFGQADGSFPLRPLQTPVQDKGFLLVANDATNLQTAKRPTVAERIDGLKHAGFAAAVCANQEVKARG